MVVDIIGWFSSNGEEVLTLFGVVLFSFVTFRALQYAVRWYLFGKTTFPTFNYFRLRRRRQQRHIPVPDSQSLKLVPPNKKWRISNEVVSLLHSVLSGVWAAFACLQYPRLIAEMDRTDEPYYPPIGYYLIYMSFGYLLHDLIDLVINERSMRIVELLFHHVVVILGLGVPMTTHYFLGVAMIGLLMEINSVFLHTRSLMNLYRIKKTRTAFKFVALLNIVTFMAFRMVPSVFLIVWATANIWKVQWYIAIFVVIVAISLASSNTVLCYRVLAADGFFGKKHARRSTTTSGAQTLPTPGADATIEADEEDDDAEIIEDEEDDDEEKNVRGGNNGTVINLPTAPSLN